MSTPEPIVVSIMPAIIGSMSRPDCVTPAPEDICRKVGRNVSAENMPMPTTRPIVVEIANVRLRNRCSGMRGSSARVSARTNSAVATTKPAESPISSGSEKS